jgi:cell division septal protein FtsQ
LAQRRFRIVRRVRRRRVRPGRLLGFLAVVAVLVGVFELMQGPFLRLHAVSVHGGPQTLWRESGLRLGVPLWAVNTGAADRALLARARFLASATFSREWPDKLSLTVTYRTAVAAAAGANGRLFGIDATGRVLGPVAALSGLPILQGIDASLVRPYDDLSQRAARAADLAAGLRAAGLNVSEVVPGTSAQVYLPSGTEVLWPSTSNTRQTLEELQAILGALKRRGAVAASIDLRVPKRPLVVLRK